MFDIGFVELVLVGIVALLVIGPERLPETIRTAAGWVRHIRRSISDIKNEIEQDLHNDKVLSELRQTKDELLQETQQLQDAANTGKQRLLDELDRPLDAIADEPVSGNKTPTSPTHD